LGQSREGVEEVVEEEEEDHQTVLLRDPLHLLHQVWDQASLELKNLGTPL